MADFLTTDIKSLFSKQQATASDVQSNEGQSTEQDKTPTDIATDKADNADSTKDSADTEVSIKRPSNFDWGAELKKRLDDNKKLSPEAQKNEIDIEDAFWEEYFKANWSDKNIAQTLINIGDQLTNLIKVIGFDKAKNPVVAFLQLDYVQKQLIATKLINVNTFKVIYEVVAKRLIADSEFRDKNNNDYNVIYCKDFYTKPLKEMIEYLKIQKNILPVNISVYDIEVQEKNKETLLSSGSDMKQPDAKLKSLVDIEKSLKDTDASNVSDSSEESASETKTDNGMETDSAADTAILSKFVNGLSSKALVQAALQYIGMTTSGKAAQKALSVTVYSGSSAELVSASKTIATQISKLKMNSQNASELVNLLLKRAKKVS